MATAVENDQYTKELAALTAALAKGPLELVKLPKELRDPAFLDYALAAGRIMLGHPEHSWEHKPGAAESHSERPKVLMVDARSINWTALDQPWHKTLYELLAEEDDQPAELRLRIKLARRKV